MFKKYEKVVALGKDEVEGILDGLCYIFEKIDGANCSVYWDEECGLCFASHNQNVYSEEHGGDFRGVVTYLQQNPQIKRMVQNFPNYNFYGEWLVKHSLNYPTFNMNIIWFYDIFDRKTEKYLSWEYIEEIFKTYEVSYIPLLAMYQNPTLEQLNECLDVNKFKASPRQEGIVIKRYDYINKFGRTQWAKIVNAEFKEVNQEVFSHVSLCCHAGCFEQEGKWICSRCNQECKFEIRQRKDESLENRIAEQFITFARVEKIVNKIEDDNSECISFGCVGKACDSCSRFTKTGKYPISEKNIPQILERVYYDMITEDIWNILKKEKQPTINFRELHKKTVDITKKIFFQIIKERREKNV